ncbi:hypothetical protein ACX27_02400 [Nostoc piscinale CENA21]|uniref:Uncharacterized protein n=1 Tax=Nostoc piscinale CENA21 TaxID=224013 RepID=A0A0M4SNM9_9NOSO|nr:hypothetical protein [Nostoc piscinale]ALF51965.1 hypothetical protein ACX27_02400 [Nostoc piscinale CENA21]
MKKIKSCTASRLLIATVVTTGALSLITPVNAQQTPETVANGIYHPREATFFREGREKLEREIGFLSKNSISAPESILKITPAKTPVIQQPPLDNPQYLPEKKALPSN